jgi:hypothetical protein
MEAIFIAVLVIFVVLVGCFGISNENKARDMVNRGEWE